MEREDGQRGRQGFPLKLVMVKKDGKMVGCKRAHPGLFIPSHLSGRGAPLYFQREVDF